MSIDKNTLLIHVESGTYPLTLSSLKSRHPSISFGASMSEEELAALGYAPVARVTRPEGDVVTEVAPVADGEGGYKQAYEVRAFNEQELAEQLANKKSMIAAQVNSVRESTLAKGAAIDFGGDAGVLHVQMRDGDRANLLGLKQGAERAFEGGVTDPVLPLRTEEDVTVMLTPEQMINVSWLVFDAYQEVMAASWAVKDAADAAQTADDLPEVPASFEPAAKALG